MSREEQLFKAIDLDNRFGGTYSETEQLIIDTIKWADANPNWHKYPDDKPKEDNDYIVYIRDPLFNDSMEIYSYSSKDNGFGYITANISSKQADWVSIDEYVKAWMEKPKLPRFD